MFNNDNYYTIPDKIYKYCGNTDYAYKAIQNHRVYMNYPIFFNDPFDDTYKKITFPGNNNIPVCKAILDFMMTDREFIDNYIDYLDFSCFDIDFFNNLHFNMMEIDNAIKAFWNCIGQRKYDLQKGVQYNPDYIKAFEYLLSRKEDIQKQSVLENKDDLVCSFSEAKDSVPMWAYYGNNHTGIAIEYDTSLLNDSVKKLLFKVIYDNERKEFCEHKRKASEWKHEKEWRLVVKDHSNDNLIMDDGKIFFDFDCISGIIFGVRYKYDDTYLKILREVKKSNHPISLYKAIMDDNKYELKINKYYQNKEEI